MSTRSDTDTSHADRARDADAEASLNCLILAMSTKDLRSACKSHGITGPRISLLDQSIALSLDAKRALVRTGMSR